MKLRTIFVIFALGLAISVPAGTAKDDQAKRATEIMTKVRQIDLLNQILPLFLTKKQLNEMLPLIEKARSDQTRMELKEFEGLVNFESRLDKAIKEGVEKDLTPSTDLMKDGVAMLQSFYIVRNMRWVEKIDGMVELLDRILDKGQKKAMVFALKPSLIEPSLDPSKLSEERRKRFFIEYILLDPAAYDLLKKLSLRK